MVFAQQYQSRINFSDNIFSYIHVHQILSYKNFAMYLSGLNNVVLQDIKKPFKTIHLDVRIYLISTTIL